MDFSEGFLKELAAEFTERAKLADAGGLPLQARFHLGAAIAVASLCSGGPSKEDVLEIYAEGTTATFKPS